MSSDSGLARVQIGPIERQLVDGVHRVVADVAGAPLWYESTDVPLDDGAEALASAVLLAAAQGGQGLSLSGPVSRAWLDNVGELLTIAAGWWDLPVVPPEAPTIDQARGRSAGTALCFTGGVDSFHTLLTTPSTPDLLAFVHGYDINLTDQPRMAEWEEDLRIIAAAVGARAVVVRSNLRAHPIHEGRDWPIVHGGALAAVGHLLAGDAGTLLISSGAPGSYQVKWGSHAQLDPLWSSERVRVVHEGGSHSRLAKVRAIVGDPLVQHHLRVCWENRSPAGNCSRCDKCVLTMVLVELCGASDRVEVFDWDGSLTGRVDEVQQTRFLRTYDEVLSSDIDRGLAGAVRSLLRRSDADVRFSRRRGRVRSARRRRPQR